jgi:hypothetical protein
VEGQDREARSRRDEASRFLAEQWGLEYREAHTLSIDPAALKVIGVGAARRLAAFPLALEGGRPVFAIAEPTNERLEAIREASDAEASFVIVNPSTLDALLSSKIFNAGSPAAASRPPAAAPPPVAPPLPPPTPPPVAPEIEAAPLLPERRAEPSAPPALPPLPPPGNPLETPELQQPTAQLDRRPPRPVLVAVGPNSSDTSSDRLGNLLTQITAGASNLASQADELVVALDANERELRAARAQLEEARLENDKSSLALEALRVELAQSQALTEAVTARLRELVHALEATQPGAGWAADATSAAALEATTRIA